jgi:AraC family transcriptional regulator
MDSNSKGEVSVPISGEDAMLARSDLEQRIESSVIHDGDRLIRSTVWEGVRVDHIVILEAGSKKHVYDSHRITIPLEGSFIASVEKAGGYRPIGQSVAGRAYLLPAGQHSISTWDGKMECLSVLLEPALVARAASEANASPAVEIVRSCHLDDPIIRQVCYGLMRESESGQPAGRLYVESLANLLAVHLFRHYSRGGAKEEPASGGLSGKRLRRAIEFIRENLAKDLNLSEIANSTGMSPFHFARAFKQSTGLTPHQHLTKMRIEKAKQLLAQSDLPIVEVCYEVGFQSQSHFTTVFRRLTGLTPRIFRGIG